MKKTCPVCKSTYEDFRKRGRFGCSECYETFSAEILTLISNIQGSLQHKGKTPHTDSKQMQNVRRVAQLRRDLERAVAEERFEDAARLRDEITEIEAKMAA